MAAQRHSLIPFDPKLAEARADIVAYAPEELEFIHAVLAQVGLPRKATTERTFLRRSGQTSIFLEAGHAPNALGEWEPLALPYGAHPRLLLIHMASEAVRTKSRVIDVGDSIRAFFARLDLSYNAVTLRHFKRQVQCLAAMHMTIAFPTEGRISTAKFDPISKFDGWLSLDPRQKSLWTDTIELTEPFYETLLAHAVPLDPRAINALQGSALALDVYTWLAHRLHRIKEAGGTTLHWHSLKEQFGQEYRDVRDFKREFRHALSKAKAVYPHASIELVHGGLKLMPSLPPIARPTLVPVGPSTYASAVKRPHKSKTPAPLAFPEMGSIYYSAPWNEIARREGGSWDIDRIADAFRQQAASKCLPLNKRNIEKTFEEFCRSYTAHRSPIARS